MKRGLICLLVLAFMLVSACSANTKKGDGSTAGAATEGAETAAVESGGSATTDWATENGINDGTQTDEDLYAAAKEEGALSVYSVSSRMQTVADSFMADYPGIEVTVYNSADEAMTKAMSEYEAGVHECDVLHCKDVSAQVYEEYLSGGGLHAYIPQDIAAKIDDKQWLTGGMPIYVELLQWFYNSNFYDEAPIDSWWDLTREEWSGKVVIPDASSGGMDTLLPEFVALTQYNEELGNLYNQEFGEEITYTCGVEDAAYELMYRIYNNNPVIVDSIDNTGEAVGAADVTEAKIGLSMSSKLRNNENKGWSLAPMTLSPTSGYAHTNFAYIVDECPHPNAAMLFVRYLTGGADGTSDGYIPWNTLGGWPVRNDIESVDTTSLSDLMVATTDQEYMYANFSDCYDFILTLLK